MRRVRCSGEVVPVSLIPLSDAIFFLPESREQPMHVASLQLYQLPADAGPGWVGDLHERWVASGEVRSLFRRRPERSLRTFGAWNWAVDDEVDLDYHVRLSALPGPGRVRELLALVSRLHATPIDRRRPLWELHLVEGLEGGRFAIYTKIHHALLDGVAGMRLLGEVLSEDPGERTPPLWAPRGERGGSTIGASGVDTAPGATPGSGPFDDSSRGSRPVDPVEGAEGDSGATPAGVPGWPASLARVAGELVGLGPAVGRRVARMLTEVDHQPLLPPRTILNVPITGSRRYAAEGWPLERIRRVAKAAGGTVNDVVLAMCASALRDYLSELGCLPDDPLVAMTPVSLAPRGSAGGRDGGNAVGAIVCDLATELPDPLERLERIQASMRRGKQAMSGLSPLQALALSALQVAPLAVCALPGLVGVLPQPFNLIISNVPGPRRTLYLDGARLLGLYPLSVPVHGQALNVTCTSYDGSLDFGLTGDRRALPHLQRLLVHLGAGLGALEAAVGA